MRPQRALLAVAAAVALYLGVVRERVLHWGATPREAWGPLPGDELLPDADVVATRAVSVEAPPAAIWPWLVQMGPGRGGAYTYDWLERRLGVDIRNTDRILPEFQQLAVGDEIPMPGYAMRVELLDPERTLALRSSDGAWAWSFLLRPAGERTRLLSRNRIRTAGYGWKDWLGYAVMEPGSLVMERRMLRTIKRNAERLTREEARSRR